MPRAFRTGLSRIAFCSLALALSNCASHPKPLALDATTNPETAINELDRDLTTAELNDQISVFAKKDYDGARKYLKEARADVKDQDNRDDTLQDIGISKAYLQQGITKAQEVAANLNDVKSARHQALQAGAAAHYPSDLKDLDKDLVDETEEGAAKVAKMKLDDKTAMQKRYLDLELRSIKASSLGDARGQIEGARKLGAKKLAPDSLKTAEEAYRSAEVAIETDRHSADIVGKATKYANESAARLVAVTQTIIDSRGRTPEQVAMELEQRRSSNAKLEGQVQAYTTALSAADQQKQQLTDKTQNLNQQLNTAKTQEAELKNQEAVITKAEKAFDKKDAEVYRQGDQVVIRLKTLNFRSGSANLPNDSIDLLGKVREVVTDFKPSKVVVEGHTDSIGSAAKNMKLSQERAEAVAKYMTTTKAIDQDAISAEGFGPERPLKPNRTRAGRAVNRRVDLILVPAQKAANEAPSAAPNSSAPQAAAPTPNAG